MTVNSDPYKILGIPRNASKAVIRQAYRRKACEWHPDKRGNDPYAVKKFQEIQKAYETLWNDSTRIEVDTKYEDDDDDEIILIDTLRLPASKQLSETYKEKLARWTAEYPQQRFIDNVDAAIANVVNTILHKYQAEFNSHMLPLMECSVCTEKCSDLSEHFTTKKKNYMTHLEKIHESNPSLTDQLATLAPDDWSWKPVDTPKPIFADIWTRMEWNNMPNLSNDLSSLRMILNSTTPSVMKDKGETSRNAKLFSNISPLKYLPNITSFISTIDKENASRSPGKMQNITKDIQSRVATGTRLSLVHESDAFPILSHICYDVQSPPSISADDSNCSQCNKILSRLLFRGSYHCRMCGRTQCWDCQIWQTCRHLGYTWPVRICPRCALQKGNLVAQAIQSHIEQSLANRFTQYLTIYIALLHHYSKQESPSYDAVERHFFASQNFIGIMQCFAYREAPCKAWLELAESASAVGAFAEAFTCFDAISQRFGYTAMQWSNIGDNYCAKGNACLAFFAYQQGKLNYEEIWTKCVLKIEKPLVALYSIEQAQQKNQLDVWVKRLIEHLSDKNLTQSAMLTLQLCERHTSYWIAILDDLASNCQYNIVAKLLSAIPSVQVQEIALKSKDPFVQCICLCFDGSVKIIDCCLAEPQINLKKLTFALVLYHIIERPDWKRMQEQYLDLRQYHKALICYKFRHSLHLCKDDDDLQWVEKALNANEPFAYLIKSLATGYSYIQLAEIYAAYSDKFEISLNFYIFASKEFQFQNGNTVSQVIESTTKLLPLSQALRCHLAIFKWARSEHNILPKILEAIYDDFQKAKKPTKNILVEFLLILESINTLNISFHFKLVNELAANFQKNIELIDTTLHFLFNNDLSTNKSGVHKMIDRYRRSLIDDEYAKIKSTVYLSITQLADALSKTTNILILEKVHHDCFGNQNMNAAPGHYKAKMHLLEGVISKLKEQYLDAVEKFNRVMVCSPSEETTAAIVMLTKDSKFRQALIKELLSTIQSIPTKGIASGFASNTQPPSIFSTENYLVPNIFLNVVRKNERAILKRLRNDPLQSAFSYIDMCSGVSDPTIIAMNFTIACMYLLQLILEARTSSDGSASIYAYKNMIEDLASQSFILSRCLLPPHMQTYIFRLLLPLLVESNRIFSLSYTRHSSQSKNTVPIIGEKQSDLITQLLNFTVHLVQVSPFIQLPTSLSYDLMYLEITGQRLLVKFLEAVLDRSYLFVYYLFEGTWKGWASVGNFTAMRAKCMEDVLATKGWNYFDVQILLDIPLIPRTNDGWLHHERKPLGLSSPLQFSKVDGISFDVETDQIKFYFQKADSNNADSMFDSNDVTEVFRQGLTRCFFTLEQPNNDFHAHPFQEMRYHPSSLLYTQYCATLLHADYLLKMLTTGTEVCAKPPFEIRPTTEGFFERLPLHLREKLKPLHDYERKHSFGRAHRFWIEADEVKYACETIGDEIRYRVADVRVRVRKHLLTRDAEGKLIDDQATNETEEEKRSAENQFAQAFTDHYDEIGYFFPELLRLKELIKLSALYVFARSRYENLKESINLYSIEMRLRELRKNITYPVATSSAVDSYYYKILSENNISSYNVSSYEESRIRSRIETQLEEVDRDIVDSLTRNLCEQAHAQISSTARSIVKAWLDSEQQNKAFAENTLCFEFTLDNPTEELAQFISRNLTAYNRIRMSKFEKLGIRARDTSEESDSMDPKDDTCNWVPAAFFNKESSHLRIYGGVNFQWQLVEGSVPINNKVSSYRAESILLSDTSISAAGPRNKQEFEKMKHNLSVSANRAASTTSPGNNVPKGVGSGHSGNQKGCGGKDSGDGSGDKSTSKNLPKEEGKGSAGIRKFISENQQLVKEAKDMKNTEATPIFPKNDTFEKKTIGNKTFYTRKSDGCIFQEDLSHYNANTFKGQPHYEVYKNAKDLEKGKRWRSVKWNGEKMQTFF